MTQPTALAPPSQKRRQAMTYQEWLAMPDEGTQSEWVDGEVIVFMPPTGIHQDIAGFLYILLQVFVRHHNLGLVRQAPFEMRLSPAVSREPDILFLARPHLDRLTPQRLDGPADLVVEIVSADSVRRDRVLKFAEYAAAGVPEYWLLDPRPGHQRAEGFRLTGGTYAAVPATPDGRIQADVLPGFWLQPAWLWQDPLPDPLACLREIAPDLLASSSPQAGS
jgi:Uma2 family endonuclease